MEIICAGHWKTGTKSCSSALRTLGYPVADAVDTAYHLAYVWADFIEERTSIDHVIGTVSKLSWNEPQFFIILQAFLATRWRNMEKF